MPTVKLDQICSCLDGDGRGPCDQQLREKSDSEELVGQKYLLIASYSKKPITIGGGCGPAGLLEQQGYSGVIERIEKVARGQPIEVKNAD